MILICYGTRPEHIKISPLLKEMDGIVDKNNPTHLYVIGATNKPWTLDNAFLRRFQKRVYVQLPSLESRIHMLKQHTSSLKIHDNVRFLDLAKVLDGYSGSDIRDACQGVQLRVVSELFDNINDNDNIILTNPAKPSIPSKRLIELSKIIINDMINRKLI